jgi:hypothetical protein
VLFKYLPIVAAVAMAAAIFVVEPGTTRKLVIGGLVAFGMLAWIALVISKSLPAELRRDATDEVLPDQLANVCDRLRQLGFQQIGAPMRVNVAPPALVIAFVHDREPIYATAFVAGANKVTAFDMISILDGERAGLTSSPNRQAATLPAELGAFRQILPDAMPDALLAIHREGLAYLHEHGLGAREVSAERFPDDFARAMASQRQAFLRAPFLYAAVALKRSIAPGSRYTRPIRDQLDTRRQIELLCEAKSELPRASARFRSTD